MIGDPSQLAVSWRSALMFSVCLPTLMAALFLLTRDVERRATVWLAAFLIAAVIAMTPQIIGFANFYDVWPGLTFAPFNTELYLGPLLYLHAFRLMRRGPLGRRWWLLAPGAVQSLYYSACFLFLGDYKQKWSYNNTIHEPFFVPLETVATISLLAWSFVAILRLTDRYAGFLRSTQSASLEFQPIWLRRLLFVVAPAALVFAVLEIVTVFVTPVSYVSAFPFLVLIMAFFAWLGFDALARLHAPFPKMDDAAPATAAPEPAGKDWKAEGERLREAVVEGRWFLEPRLSISDVARRLATNERYVSQALNQGVGQPFSDFINGLRIDHAKKRLGASDDQILDIALASGFNSKATFNRVFKDVAGETPSAYRASQIAKTSEK